MSGQAQQSGGAVLAQMVDSKSPAVAAWTDMLLFDLAMTVFWTTQIL